MATFKTGIKVSDKGAAEGRKAWEGELPPSGSYDGILRTVTIKYITSEESKNKGKPKLLIGVELTNTRNGEFDGYMAWHSGLNLIDGSEAYVNQWLLALTDGSDKQFNQIKAAFDKGFATDERKKHVLKIGRWNINSPKGELPIKVSLKKEPFYNERTKQSGYSTKIVSFLTSEDNVGPQDSGGAPEEAVEEETDVVDVDADEDEDYEDGDEDLLED